MRHNLRFYGGKCCFSLVNLAKVSVIRGTLNEYFFFYYSAQGNMRKSHKSLIISGPELGKEGYFLYFSGYFRILRFEYIPPTPIPNIKGLVSFCFPYYILYFFICLSMSFLLILLSPTGETPEMVFPY